MPWIQSTTLLTLKNINHVIFFWSTLQIFFPGLYLFNQIIGPYKRVLNWIDDTKNDMEPHFQEVHVILFKAKQKFHNQRYDVESSIPQSNIGEGK